MTTKTMLDIAIATVSQDPSKEYSFYDIFDKVEEELKDSWVEKFVTPTTTYDKIRETKMGELHRLLTVDKRFEWVPAQNKWVARNI
ncbi:hypothetical protein H9M94_01880 [Mycoplasma sp. Pen4]|nr:hypothetical protein H9M94_01880 [Mycoplasma sp. Pen4]